MKGYYKDDYSWLKGLFIAVMFMIFFFWIQGMTGGVTIQFSNEPKVKALETQVAGLEDELDICKRNLLAECSPVECRCPDCGLTAVVFFFVGGFIFIVISAWFKKFLNEYTKEVTKRANKEKTKK